MKGRIGGWGGGGGSHPRAGGFYFSDDSVMLQSRDAQVTSFQADLATGPFHQVHAFSGRPLPEETRCCVVQAVLFFLPSLDDKELHSGLVQLLPH